MFISHEPQPLHVPGTADGSICCSFTCHAIGHVRLKNPSVPRPGTISATHTSALTFRTPPHANRPDQLGKSNTGSLRALWSGPEEKLKTATKTYACEIMFWTLHRGPRRPGWRPCGTPHTTASCVSQKVAWRGHLLLAQSKGCMNTLKKARIWSHRQLTSSFRAKEPSRTGDSGTLQFSVRSPTHLAICGTGRHHHHPAAAPGAQQQSLPLHAATVFAPSYVAYHATCSSTA